jgi:predicted dehydrogenase
MSEMFRLGLVGVGSWAMRCAATLARRDDCRITLYARGSGTGDVPIEGATRADDWRALLDRARRGELDGIVVATTPEHQAEVAEAAVLAGVPAVVEKPIGLSRTAAERVLTAVRSSQSAPPLLVNYVQLYTPGHRALRALVREAGVPLVSIETEGSNRGPFRRFSSLYDYGPHDLSLCLDLCGAQSPFHVLEVTKRPGAEAGELFEVELSLGSTRVAMRVGSGGSTKMRRFSATLAGGRTLTSEPLAPSERLLLDGGVPVPVSETLPLDVMFSEFLERVARFRAGLFDRETELRNAAFSVRVNEILDAIAKKTS